MEHSARATLRCLCALSLVAGLAPFAGTAQEVDAPDFAIENAVLDTSILFVAGAQEAEQELRGAFGWPTFQEGLAEGIYYRFDPDGYARFAPTDRLDTDVFEVICRSRTVTCTAHKGILSVVPTGSGQLQIVIGDLVEGEQFFLIEGTSELQLPDQILQPMDARIESLLSSNGELVIRRGAEDRARVSLVGLGQTLAYLRWVAARQDYAVLPRDWPVPTGATDAPTRLTEPVEWGKPVAAAAATVVPADLLPAAADAIETAELDALRREVETLRSLLVPAAPVEPAAAPLPEVVAATAPPVAAPNAADVARITALESMVAALSSGLASGAPCGTEGTPPCLPSAVVPAAGPAVVPAVAPTDPALPDPQRFAPSGDPVAAGREGWNAVVSPEVADIVPNGSVPVPALFDAAETDQAKRLAQINYLITEIGLDSETALMVLELGPLGPDRTVTDSPTCRNSSLDLAFSDAMTREALTDLAEPLATVSPMTAPADPSTGIPDTFVFLSDYLKTIQPAEGR